MKCVCLLVLLGALAACTDFGPPLTGQAQANAQTVTACRRRVDQTLEQQDRGRVYSPQSQVNIPFSASYVPGISDRGLAQQYQYDSMVSDCVRNTGTTVDRNQPK
jgi:hypothetical protein